MMRLWQLTSQKFYDLLTKARCLGPGRYQRILLTWIKPEDALHFCFSLRFMHRASQQRQLDTYRCRKIW